MRSDVKVGLICVFVLLIGVVAYFAMNKGDKPANNEVNNSATPGIQIANPNNSGGGAALISPPPVATQPTTMYGPTEGLVSTTQPTTQATVRLTGPGEYSRPITPIPLLPTTQPAAVGMGPVDSGRPVTPTTRPTIDMDPIPVIPGLTPSLTPVNGTPTDYVVKKGDLLTTIAKANRTTVKEIVKLNPGLNPDKLSVNQKIKLPAPGTGLSVTTRPADRTATTRPGRTATTRPSMPPTTRSAAAPGSTYVVKRGDDLRKIALSVYGDKDAWQKIYNANRDVIRDPDNIRAGMKLKLPAQ